VVSFGFALVGLAVLLVFVPNRQASTASADDRRALSVRPLLGLLAGRAFRALLVIATMLSFVTISDTFLYLGLQRRLNFGIGYFPLLYVVTALVYMLLAAPVGWLADRWGRGRVFVAGHVLLIVSYIVLLLPLQTGAVIWLSLVLLGAYYAATDGVLAALGSALLPVEVRASGLALLVTAISVGRLVSSLLFGLLWTWWGVQAAVALFAVGLSAATLAAAVAFARLKGAVADG
jgi:MFS family permease